MLYVSLNCQPAKGENAIPSWLHGSICISLIGADELTDNMPFDRYMYLFNFDTMKTQLIKIPSDARLMRQPDNHAPIVVSHGPESGTVIDGTYYRNYQIYTFDPQGNTPYLAQEFRIENPLQMLYVQKKEISETELLEDPFREILDQGLTSNGSYNANYIAYYLAISIDDNSASFFPYLSVKSTDAAGREANALVNRVSNTLIETLAVSVEGNFAYIEYNPLPNICINRETRIPIDNDSTMGPLCWYDKETLLFTVYDHTSSHIMLCNTTKREIYNIGRLWNAQDIELSGIVGAMDINYKDSILAMVFPHLSSEYINEYDDPIVFLNLKTGETFCWKPWRLENSDHHCFGKENSGIVYYQPSMGKICEIAWWNQK